MIFEKGEEVTFFFLKVVMLGVILAIVCLYCFILWFFSVLVVIKEEIEDGIANGYNEFIEKQALIVNLD